ncbi:MAG: hypothetical protein ACP6IS_05970 [Candidatus Asgardarchaeia archaeon]
MPKAISAGFSVVTMAFIYTWMGFTFLINFRFLIPEDIAIEYKLKTTIISQINFIFGEILLNYDNHILFTILIWGATAFIVGLGLEKVSQIITTSIFALFFAGLLHTIIMLTSVYLELPLIIGSPEKLIAIFQIVINDLKPILLPHLTVIILGSGLGYKISERLLAIEEEEEIPEEMITI